MENNEESSVMTNPTSNSVVTSSDSGEDSYSPTQQQEVEPTQLQDIWDSDSRYEKMWKKDPNELYKSFRNIEKMYSPLQKKYKDLESKISSYDSEISGYKDKIGAYSEVEKIINFLDSNPTYQKEILGTINRLAEEGQRNKYGDLPPEAISRLERAEQLEAKFAEMENEKHLNHQIEVLNTQLSEIDKIAEQLGVEYDKKDFLMYCDANNIPPHMAKAVFMEKGFEQMQTAIRSAAISEDRKKATEIKQKSIGASAARAPKQLSGSIDDLIIAALQGKK